jgi:glutamine synthetase
LVVETRPVESTRQDAIDQIQRARSNGIRFIQLQFTDIIGSVKAVTIPIHQLQGSVEHGTWFDGSSIEGFTGSPSPTST